MKSIRIKFIIVFTAAFVFSCGGNNAQNAEDESSTSSEEAMKEVEDAMGADAGSKSILTNSDIDRFIKSVIPMSKELEALSSEFDYDKPDPALKELFKSKEVLAIANKYGWNEDFGQKYMAITMGVSYLAMEEQMNNLPEAQREQYKEMISTQWESYKSMINDDDLALIRPRLNEIMMAVSEDE